MDNGTSSLIDKYNQRINAFVPTPRTYTQQYGNNMPNAATNYSLNNDYAVGSRTYNGSSPSPQAGPGSVDPAGYATRDNMAKTKNTLLASYLQQGM